MFSKLLPYSILLSCFLPTLSYGEILTQEEALDRVFTSTRNMVAGEKYELAYQGIAPDASPSFYVYNIRTGGWVILSADDSAAPVLAYNKEGRFWPDSLPVAMNRTLECYSQEMGALRKAGAKEYQKVESKTEAIVPLLGNIAWNQDSPFNDMCPTYYGNLRSATGCAATAMAQILFYHKYPEVGEGVHTYIPTVNTSIGELSVDFSQSHYQWDKMLERYDADSDDEARAAVAKLMFDCGVAISMEYGEQSGAMSIDWCEALTTHFKYDRGVTYRLRNYYSIEEWESVIQNELEEGRPVYVTGYCDDGGHAFVFDGSDGEGFFHVNWGWGGMSNGYFRTTALTPPTQGIGGSTGGFNSKQLIITGIKGAEEGSEPAVSLISSEPLKCTPSKTTQGGTVQVKLNGTITNVGWQDAKFDAGIGIYDSVGNLKCQVTCIEDLELAKDATFRSIDFGQIELPMLDEGEYIMRPLCKWAGGNNWDRIRDSYIGLPNYLKMNVTDESVFFSSPEFYSLQAEEININSDIIRGVRCNVTAQILNVGESEYYGNVRLALYDSDTKKKVTEGEKYLIDLMPNQSAWVDLSDSFDVDPGFWLLSIIDEDQQKIHDFINIEVKESTAGTLSALRAISFEDNTNVPKDDVRLYAEVGCKGGAFGGTILVYIYDAAETDVVCCLDPIGVYLNDDESIELTFSGPFENGVPGTTYKATLVNGETMTYVEPTELSKCMFTLTEASNLEPSIISDNEAVSIYNFQGLMMGSDTNQLPKGIYIIVTEGHSGISVSKYIKQ